MEARILCVDDEPNILQAFQRQLRRFAITTAPSGPMGLSALKEGPPFAVVVSDFRMPGMNGVQFLAEVKRESPDTVRIMLTGQADLSSAAEAVNEGNIFRFLLKPCPSDQLARALDAAIEQHRLVHAERELLEKTLKGAIEVLSEILGMVHPEAFGRAYRMREYVRQFSAALNLPDQWQYEVAAMLSQVGCLAVPTEILDKICVRERLTEEERKVYASHFQIGHDLLARIPRMGAVAEMVRQQGQAGPANRPAADDPLSIGSEMLRLASAFDDAVIAGMSNESAAESLSRGGQYNPALVAVLESLGEQKFETDLRAVKVSELQPGMRSTAEVYSRSGLLLLGKDQEITPSVIICLKRFSLSPAGVTEPVKVRSRRYVSADIPDIGAAPAGPKIAAS